MSNIDDIIVNPSVIQKETDKTLRTLLDIPVHMPAVLVENSLLPVNQTAISQDQFDKMVDEDFFSAKENVKTLLDKGKSSLNALILLAGASDNPRAYEVVATLIKTLSEVNNDMMGLHKKRKEAKEVKEAPTKNTTNNNLFVGSTEDALKMLNKDKEIDEETF